MLGTGFCWRVLGSQSLIQSCSAWSEMLFLLRIFQKLYSESQMDRKLDPSCTNNSFCPAGQHRAAIIENICARQASARWSTHLYGCPRCKTLTTASRTSRAAGVFFYTINTINYIRPDSDLMRGIVENNKSKPTQFSYRDSRWNI